ncbi:MAG TPA: polysaccharide deacetylase family protein [Candidatus Paceibacterota bacterium]
MRHLVFRLLSICGMVSLLRCVHKNSLTVILYHGIAPKDEGSGMYNYRRKFIDPAHFEKQLAYLKAHYTILPLEEALSLMWKKELPPAALAITFDDGYENNFLHAFPILKRAELSATFFVTTDFVFGRKPLWVDRLEYACGAGDTPRGEKEKKDDVLRNEMKKFSPEEREDRLAELETKERALTNFEGERRVYAPLSEAQMKEMARGGMSIGAHTQTHPILSRILPEEARSEIALSKLALEQHGFAVSPIFAYPNGQPGDWNERTEEAAAEIGFTAALTTVQGVNTHTTHQFRLKRIALDGTDDDLYTFAAIVASMRLYLSQLKHVFV